MNKLWSDRAWDDYLYWQLQDKKIVKKINELVKDIERNFIPHSYRDRDCCRGAAVVFFDIMYTK